MPSTEERIREIEEEIRRTPYNKATQKHLGRLRARLARLKAATARPRGGGKGAERVRKVGDATVALAGYPSVGKSTLLNVITEATSRVGDYDFTTLRAVPGMLSHRGARIQVLDLPGLTEGAARGRGRGPEVLSQARIADLLLLMVDVHHPDVDPLLTELQEGSIRIDQEPPQVSLRRADRGGLHVAFTGPQTELDADTVREVTREWGMVNGQITIREDLTVDRLVDHLAGNRVYVPGLVALNKIDLIGEGELDRILRMLEGRTVVPISAKAEVGIDLLIETIYARLSFIRVYLKPPGQKDAAEEPIILRDGGTVADVCRLLHRDFVRRFRRAEVWGPSARYPGQRVGVEHALRDGDVLSLSARPG